MPRARSLPTKGRGKRLNVTAQLTDLRPATTYHYRLIAAGAGRCPLARGADYTFKTAPLPVPPVFELISEGGSVPAAEMWEVFNMGCGFCAMVAPDDAAKAAALLDGHHPGAAVVGRVTEESGRIALPELGLTGDSGGLKQA